MTEQEDAVLAEIREALTDPQVGIHLVPTFTHGTAVQVRVKTRKIGPLLFAEDGPAGVLRMLADLMGPESDGAE